MLSIFYSTVCVSIAFQYYLLGCTVPVRPQSLNIINMRRYSPVQLSQISWFLCIQVARSPLLSVAKSNFHTYNLSTSNMKRSHTLKTESSLLSEVALGQASVWWMGLSTSESVHHVSAQTAMGNPSPSWTFLNYIVNFPHIMKPIVKILWKYLKTYMFTVDDVSKC